MFSKDNVGQRPLFQERNTRRPENAIKVPALLGEWFNSRHCIGHSRCPFLEAKQT
jgi:hypothetical protein